MKKKLKKNTELQEQSLGPIQIKKDVLIHAMRRLVLNEDFKLLRSLWLGKRWKLLEDGKATPTAEQWHVIKGFDAAVMEVHKWADMELTESRNKPAEELQESL